MGFSIEQFGKLRPYLYHVTTPENFENIRRRWKLISAFSLLKGTDYEYLLRGLRSESHVVRLNGQEIVIRDHRPLRLGSIEFEGGWTINTLLEELNRRVFFWPGRADGPIRSGRLHFGRYAAEGQVVAFRVNVFDLLQANPDNRPYFSRANSGSARHSGGKPVVRGPRLYQTAEQSSFPVNAVKEVSYLYEAVLPTNIEYSHRFGDNLWSRLKMR